MQKKYVKTMGLVFSVVVAVSVMAQPVMAGDANTAVVNSGVTSTAEDTSDIIAHRGGASEATSEVTSETASEVTSETTTPAWINEVDKSIGEVEALQKDPLVKDQTQFQNEFKTQMDGLKQAYEAAKTPATTFTNKDNNGQINTTKVNEDDEDVITYTKGDAASLQKAMQEFANCLQEQLEKLKGILETRNKIFEEHSEAIDRVLGDSSDANGVIVPRSTVDETLAHRGWKANQFTLITPSNEAYLDFQFGLKNIGPYVKDSMNKEAQGNGLYYRPRNSAKEGWDPEKNPAKDPDYGIEDDGLTENELYPELYDDESGTQGLSRYSYEGQNASKVDLTNRKKNSSYIAYVKDRNWLGDRDDTIFQKWIGAVNEDQIEALKDGVADDKMEAFNTLAASLTEQGFTEALKTDYLALFDAEGKEAASAKWEEARKAGFSAAQKEALTNLGYLEKKIQELETIRTKGVYDIYLNIRDSFYYRHYIRSTGEDGELHFVDLKFTLTKIAPQPSDRSDTSYTENRNQLNNGIATSERLRLRRVLSDPERRIDRLDGHVPWFYYENKSAQFQIEFLDSETQAPTKLQPMVFIADIDSSQAVSMERYQVDGEWKSLVVTDTVYEKAEEASATDGTTPKVATLAHEAEAQPEDNSNTVVFYNKKKDNKNIGYLSDSGILRGGSAANEEMRKSWALFALPESTGFEYNFYSQPNDRSWGVLQGVGDIGGSIMSPGIPFRTASLTLPRLVALDPPPAPASGGNVHIWTPEDGHNQPDKPPVEPHEPSQPVQPSEPTTPSTPDKPAADEDVSVTEPYENDGHALTPNTGASASTAAVTTTTGQQTVATVKEGVATGDASPVQGATVGLLAGLLGMLGIRRRKHSTK